MRDEEREEEALGFEPALAAALDGVEWEEDMFADVVDGDGFGVVDPVLSRLCVEEGAEGPRVSQTRLKMVSREREKRGTAARRLLSRME